MRGHSTLNEMRWPMDDESRQQARRWASSVALRVLDWTWRGFDALHQNVLRHIHLQSSFEQLERNLVALHYVEIQKIVDLDSDGFVSIAPVHEHPELESRSPAPAKPPAYDLAFVWQDNPRVAWPIEAKVLATVGTLAHYLGDVRKFTDGTAAPITGEGAQIAYLLAGSAEAFFRNLGQHLATPLLPIPALADRPHRHSTHTREAAPELRLHHMVMVCGLGLE